MKKQKPFFARFLEDQLSESTSSSIVGGITQKYPSDIEDVVTMRIGNDLIEPQTQKYPSDSEES